MDMLLLAASTMLGASPAVTSSSAVASANAEVNAATAAADDAQAGETDKQRIERLENMVEELSRRLDNRDRQEGQANGQGEAVARAPRQPSDHKLELYGFAQFDAIQDFNRVNPDWEAALRPSRIPTTEGLYGSDGQTILSGLGFLPPS